MKFEELDVPGVFLLETEPFTDERGSFARTFCTDEFAEHGLEVAVAQCSVSTNARRGTLRGMHLQLAPHEETKLVRCTRGAVFDVAVDLRPESETLGRWVGRKLDADSRYTLYIPRGIAHGFVTLEDDSWIEYIISAPYMPEASVGISWEDPGIDVRWPIGPAVMSQRDQELPFVDLERARRSGLAAALGRA